MKKILLITLFMNLISLQARSQTADLASAIAGETSSGQPYEEKKLDTQVADDRGAFSFLNFSFIKKPLSLFSFGNKEDEEEKNEDKSENEKKETPLERATRLAENGDVDNALTLGYVYLYGQDGVEADYKKAFHFYTIAAAQNNVIALNNLGSLYFNGIGTPVNYQKAAKLFEQAAELGSDDAAINLAFIYLSSDNPAYFETAVSLFEQAAKLGNNTAKFMVGYAYYKGFVVEQDLHKAVEFIREAANANFDEAHYVFANIYANGDGIAKNYGNAVKHYRAAIAQGNIDAMMALAHILAEGRMYPMNLVQAHIFYNIASVYGVKEAATRRDVLEKDLKLEELLEAQNTAEAYHEEPSELTQYIRQTFGSKIRLYIDNNLSKIKGSKL